MPRKFLSTLLALVMTLSLIMIPSIAADADEPTIRIAEREYTVEEGQSVEVKATVRNAGSEDPEIVWSSSDKTVFTVNDEGVVTGVSEGRGVVTARLKGNDTIKNYADIIVTKSTQPKEEEKTADETETKTAENEDADSDNPFVALTDFSVEEQEITMKAKETVPLTVTYKPENATLRPVWSSSDEKIATVNDNGEITGTGLGTAYITGRWLLKTAVVKVTVQFSDVEKTEYYYEPVYWALANGVTGGMNATDFKPNATCTRGQIMTFLWKINGSPEPDTGNNPFTDVSSDRFFYKPILWAYQSGLTTGTTATTFSPEQPCSRGQVVQFLWGCQKNKETRGVTFTDVKNTAYYYHAVKWAFHNGITSGTSNTTFSPNNACTRGQIITFLYQCRDNGLDIYDPEKVAQFDDRAARVLDQVGWNLRAAFNWSAGLTYFGHNSEMPSDESPGIDWFANYGFDHHKGNCYVMACTFYRMAKMMDYEVYVMSGSVPSARGGMTPHSWTEVVEDGTVYVYDPNFTNETGGNGFRISYGQSGTWRYANYHRMTN